MGRIPEQNQEMSRAQVRDILETHAKNPCLERTFTHEFMRAVRLNAEYESRVESRSIEERRFSREENHRLRAEIAAKGFYESPKSGTKNGTLQLLLDVVAIQDYNSLDCKEIAANLGATVGAVLKVCNRYGLKITKVKTASPSMIAKAEAVAVTKTKKQARQEKHFTPERQRLAEELAKLGYRINVSAKEKSLTVLLSIHNLKGRESLTVREIHERFADMQPSLEVTRCILRHYKVPHLSFAELSPARKEEVAETFPKKAPTVNLRSGAILLQKVLKIDVSNMKLSQIAEAVGYTKTRSGLGKLLRDNNIPYDKKKINQ